MLHIERFLRDNFGDVDGVLGLLAAHDLPMPNREAVRKWFSRASLTADWLAVLSVALKRETGLAVDLEPYLRDIKHHDIFA